MLPRVVTLTVAGAFAALAHAAGDALGCPSVRDTPADAREARECRGDALFTRPESPVPAGKRTVRGLYVTAVDAYDMVREAASAMLFIDVRTRGELQFIGMRRTAKLDRSKMYALD